jgi:hypothetical protein
MTVDAVEETAMKAAITVILAVASLAASAREAVDLTPRTAAERFEAVDSIPALTRMHSWHAVDDDTLVVWATAFDPYLVELSFPSHDLKYALSIGVSKTAGRIHAKFDSIYVRGYRYGIDNIYRLSPEEARAL